MLCPMNYLTHPNTSRRQRPLDRVLWAIWNLTGLVLIIGWFVSFYLDNLPG